MKSKTNFGSGAVLRGDVLEPPYRVAPLASSCGVLPIPTRPQKD